MWQRIDDPDEVHGPWTTTTPCCSSEGAQCILMYLRKIQNQKTEWLFTDEPLNVDWDGNELCCFQILWGFGRRYGEPQELEQEVERTYGLQSGLGAEQRYWRGCDLAGRGGWNAPKGGSGYHWDLAILYLAVERKIIRQLAEEMQSHLLNGIAGQKGSAGMFVPDHRGTGAQGRESVRCRLGRPVPGSGW